MTWPVGRGRLRPVDESTLRTLLGTDLAEDSDFDLHGTLGLPTVPALGGIDPESAEAPTVVLEDDDPGQAGDESISESALVETGYELVEEIGRGGMNVVFRARQLGLERDVAVKRLRSKRRSHRFARWSFLSEAVATAQLDHPNVMPIHGLSVDNAGDVALAMKLMRGKSWAQRLREDFADPDGKQAPPNLDQNLQVLVAVCNAVSFAHSKGVLHRDLKPDNVMIGEFGEVLVVDWGLAVRFSDTDLGVRAPHRSAVRKLAGTPVYMAPEMVEGNGDALGPPTDIYLLGGVLHSVLTGQPPHQGDKLIDVLLEATEARPPVFPGSVPAELQDICRRALARAPGDRFESVAEFRDAIEGYRSHSESLALCTRAVDRLAQCRETSEAGIDFDNRAHLYSDLRDVIASFSAAREIWPANAVAAEGEVEARLLLARSALSMGELGAAESALTGQSGEEVADLRGRIDEALAGRERTLRSTRRASFFLVVLQLVVALALGTWGYFELRAYHYDIEVAELKRVTPLAAMAIGMSKETDAEGLVPLVQRIAEEIAQQQPFRLTVTDPGGHVLADSERSPSTLPNHWTRPEFADAAREGIGVSSRYSETLKLEMVYLALPVRDAAGEIVLYVRGALPLDFVNQELQALVAAVGISALLSVIAICLVTILLSRHLGKALQRLR